MDRRTYLTVFICALLVLSLAHSVQASQLMEPDFAAIDAHVETQMREARIPGVALGITRGNQIVHLRGFGVADRSGRPVTPQTPFIIGSLSKSFTALAVMQLVEEGKIELEAPVQRYIPWFSVADPYASTRITVRHLLYHTSGIPNNTGLWVAAGTGETKLEQRIREMNSIALAHPPGTTFEYSNANYMLLGLLVQTVSGQSYEAYVPQHIFTPLSMQNSFVSQSEAMQHGMATGYRWWFGVPFPADVPYLQDALPAGYIISSAEDMTRFLIVNLNEGRYGNVSVLSPTGIAELHRPAVKAGGEDYYGMGWVIGSASGTPILTHSGDAANFHADMFLVPGKQWGIVVLTNVANMLAPLSGSVRIAEGVTKLLLGRQPSGAGLSFGTLYLIVDFVVLLLTLLLIRSIVLLPRWRRQLIERYPRRLLGFLWHIVLPTLVDLAWPLIFLIILPMGSGFPLWPVMALFQPDLTYWLMVMALVTLAKGIIRPVLAFSVFRVASKA